MTARCAEHRGLGMFEWKSDDRLLSRDPM